MSFDPATYEKLGAFYLGRERDNPAAPVLLDSRDLTTHGVVVGMTGSGKTGLAIAILEEALIDRVPAIVIDPKGDLGNLKLVFGDLAARDFEPWVEGDAAATAARWRAGLAEWGQGPDRVRRLADAGEVTLYTPGSTAGRPVSILGSLAAPPAATVDDAELFADRVSSTATSLLALLGNANADPLQDAEHVFLSTLLQDAWRRGQGLDLAGLIRAIANPPFDRIGVLALDDVFDARARGALAMRANNLLAAPAFAPWLQGDDLDVEKFLHAGDRPRVSVFSIAHLDDAERMFFVSLLAGRVLDWTRQQAGTSSLRALLFMDEIFGFLPPVANPPSKRPLLAMLKQARAFGVGVVLATQNPVDIDYKALSNAGTWFIGKLQTERDVERVVDGLLGADDSLDRAALLRTIAGLDARQFLMNNVHEDGPRVMETRWVMSYLRGPMTKAEIRRVQSAEPGAAAWGAPAATSRPAAASPTGSPRSLHLPVTVPGAADEQLLWRPMAYGAGDVRVDGEVTAFGFIRGLRGGDFTWADSTPVLLDRSEFARASGSGTYLEADPAAQDPTTWESWARELKTYAGHEVVATRLSCPKLRLNVEPGESEAAFRKRVDLAVREKRDAAVDKLRDQWMRKIEQLEDQLARARDALERQQDQARDAQLDAAVNVGEALWGMLGGRRRSMSASRATRVVRESRDVDRAEDKVKELVGELHDLRSQMETALVDENAAFDASQFPIQASEKRPRQSDVEVRFCELVWVPYWQRPDGNRRRATG